MGEPVFLIAFVIAASTVVLVARTIAGVFVGRRASRSELAQLREQVEQHAAALEDAQTSLAEQSV